jgi:hypothetical protein
VLNLTRYLPKCLIAGLAGLASVVVLASAAAPAGAKTVCTTLPPPYQTCLSLSVSVKSQKHKSVKVTVKVSDSPSVTVNFYRFKNHKYRYVRTVFSGTLTGTAHFKLHPKHVGKYELKVTASESTLSTTVTKKFKVKP